MREKSYKTFRLEEEVMALLDTDYLLEKLREFVSAHPKLDLSFDCTDEGATLLHLVTEKEKAEFLVKKGLSVFAKTTDGSGVLHYATACADEELMGFYIEKGVSVSDRDVYGKTPLLTTALLGLKDKALFLVSKGASFAERDNRGLSALHYTSLLDQKNHIEYAQMLLDKGKLDINDLDNDNNSVLHTAMSADKIDVDFLKFLLARGANPILRNKKGKTALDLLQKRSAFTKEYVVLQDILKTAILDWAEKEQQAREMFNEFVENVKAWEAQGQEQKQVAENIIKDETKEPIRRNKMRSTKNTSDFSIFEIAQAKKKNPSIHLIDDLALANAPKQTKNAIKTAFFALDSDMQDLIVRATGAGHNIVINDVAYTKANVPASARVAQQKRIQKAKKIQRQGRGARED